MDNIDIQIANEYRRMLERIPGAVCHSGIVRAVDEAGATCEVELTMMDSEAERVTALLNATEDTALGVIAYPTVGSDVLVAAVDGGGIYVVLLLSKVDKVVVNVGGSAAELVVTEGKVVMNGGNLGGLLKVVPTVSEFTKIQADINQLKTLLGAIAAAMAATAAAPGAAALPVTNAVLSAYFTTLPPWAAAVLPPTTRAMIENIDVKH